MLYYFLIKSWRYFVLLLFLVGAICAVWRYTHPGTMEIPFIEWIKIAFGLLITLHFVLIMVDPKRFVGRIYVLYVDDLYTVRYSTGVKSTYRKHKYKRYILPDLDEVDPRAQVFYNNPDCNSYLHKIR